MQKIPKFRRSSWIHAIGFPENYKDHMGRVLLKQIWGRILFSFIHLVSLMFQVENRALPCDSCWVARKYHPQSQKQNPEKL